MDHDPRMSAARMIYILDRFASRYARRVLAPFGLGKEQLFALGSLIREGDGITQEALAGRLYVDKSTAARTVAALEKMGLVDRRPVKGNARANRILVTAKARQVFAAIEGKLWCWEDILLAGFTEGEREKLVAMLQRMESNAAEAWASDFVR